MESAKIKMQDSATLQEILSQPLAWKESLRALEGDAAIESILEKTASKNEWLFIGCGTSFYLAEAAASSWTILTGERSKSPPRLRATVISDAQLAAQLPAAGCDYFTIRNHIGGRACCHVPGTRSGNRNTRLDVLTELSARIGV